MSQLRHFPNYPTPLFPSVPAGKPLTLQEMLNALQRRNRLRYLNDLAAEKDPGFALELRRVRNPDGLDEFEAEVARAGLNEIARQHNSGMGGVGMMTFLSNPLPTLIGGGIIIIAGMLFTVWMTSVLRQTYVEENAMLQQQPALFSLTRIFPLMLVAGSLVVGSIAYFDYKSKNRFGGGGGFNVGHTALRSKEMDVEGEFIRAQYAAIAAKQAAVAENRRMAIEAQQEAHKLEMKAMDALTERQRYDTERKRVKEDEREQDRKEKKAEKDRRERQKCIDAGREFDERTKTCKPKKTS